MSYRSVFLLRQARGWPMGVLAASALLGLAVTGSAQAQGPGGFSYGSPPGTQLFQQNCASCHAPTATNDQSREGNDQRTAPPFTQLRTLSPDTIYEAITTGEMTAYASQLNDKEKRDLTEYIAGRPFLDVKHLGVQGMTNQCPSNPPLGTLHKGMAWTGWGPRVNNARFQNGKAAGLTAADVPNLKLKWAFGIPGGGIMVSQPTVAMGRLFIGSDNRFVYSIDAKTGCAYWAFPADSAGRFAPMVGRIEGHPGIKYAVFFVTSPGTAYAVDAHTGKLIWKTQIEGGMFHVSNSSTFYAGRIYVPLAGTETLIGHRKGYSCCHSRGGVAAIDANTGKVVWKTSTIEGPVRQLGTTKDGEAVYGPSGASVWNAPTVDPKRGLVYVGTGNSYGPVAAKTSDSILALSMYDGHIVWHHQQFEGDAFMLGCPRVNNDNDAKCPPKLGPDYDFGGSSAILQTLPNGKDIIVAAGKGGEAIGLDPDHQGKLVWETTLYKPGHAPSPAGLVLFGGTADGHKAYYPLQAPGGGLIALDLKTGHMDWNAAINADRRGQSGAATSMPGVVFTGGWDGILRAVDSNDGKVIWTYNAEQTYDHTVNGVPAHGGALGVTSPTIDGGMIYLGAGYIGVQGGKGGNVLLAFGAN